MKYTGKTQGDKPSHAPYCLRASPEDLILKAPVRVAVDDWQSQFIATMDSVHGDRFDGYAIKDGVRVRGMFSMNHVQAYLT